MTVQVVTDLKMPISEVIKAAGPDGLLLESEGQPSYALIPLDDELLDFLIERNPKFIDACRQIRARMTAGQFHAHEAVKAMFGAS